MSAENSRSRRSFLQVTAFSLGCGAIRPAFQGLLANETGHSAASKGYGAVRPVNDQTTGLPLLQLPDGFQYASFGWTGDPLENEVLTPSSHDGMAVVSDENGIVTLCRNHELKDAGPAFGPEDRTYDPRVKGGCVQLQFDAEQGNWLKAWPSLSGTSNNCAGGATPWQSWLSCEETVLGPGDEYKGVKYDYLRDHGWIFEVPANGVASTQPLKAMGRFVHEAVAVDAETGYVYETEDRGTAGLYRFRPKVPGQLADGGDLEMLRVDGHDDLRAARQMGVPLGCSWVPIEDPERAHEDAKAQDALGCFSQGKKQGGTTFARLEGCWYGNGKIYFNSTSGGPAESGQVWQFDPRQQTLTLIFVSPGRQVLDMPDNLAVSPRGGIVLCEDGDLVPQRLHGLTPKGQLFLLAKNNVQLRGERNGIKGDFRDSEWAGATFSADGRWLFVNIQTPGITFAITGPWGEGLI